MDIDLKIEIPNQFSILNQFSIFKMKQKLNINPQ